MTLLVPRRASTDSPRQTGLDTMWRAAAEGAGLSRTVETVTGGTVVAPPLTAATVEHGDVVLTVRVLAGQLPEDYRAAGTRLAAALGVARVAVEPVSPYRLRLRLLRRDPLAAVVHLPASYPRGLVGYGEDGTPLVLPLARRPHTVVQGQTGSGKSVWTYIQLAGVAGDPRTLVAGLDPTGLLFRPFAGSRHTPWQVSGLGDMDGVLALLDRLTTEMDRRIAAMPEDRDNVVCSLEVPALLVVLEEYAGLLRAADVAGKAIGQRVRAQVGRLLAEGRKAGVRVLLIVQRADAAVVDGMARAQCGLRVSFSVDSPEAVRMLHPAAVDPGDVLAAPAGVALVSAPGTPLARVRAPLMRGGYREYVARVRAALSGPLSAP